MEDKPLYGDYGHMTSDQREMIIGLRNKLDMINIITNAHFPEELYELRVESERPSGFIERGEYITNLWANFLSDQAEKGMPLDADFLAYWSVQKSGWSEHPLFNLSLKIGPSENTLTIFSEKKDTNPIMKFDLLEPTTEKDILYYTIGLHSTFNSIKMFDVKPRLPLRDEVIFMQRLASETRYEILERARQKLIGFCGEEFLLSGDDSGLENIWEEICVQQQGEMSYHWDIYIETMNNVLEAEIEQLSPMTNEIMCYQYSDAFMDDEKNVDLDDADLLGYLRGELLNMAETYENERISGYLEGNIDDEDEGDEYDVDDFLDEEDGERKTNNNP